jgi:hypothetical protein
MEKTLVEIWLREAPYRYRIYYFLMAVTLVMPKPTSMFLEDSIIEKGFWETYLPLFIEYGSTAMFGLLAFSYGHFSGFLMRNILMKKEIANYKDRRFSIKYILAFTAAPILFFFFFELFHLLVLRQMDFFSSAAGVAGFVSRVTAFSLGMFLIMALFGAISLRGLRRFVKLYVSLPTR